MTVNIGASLLSSYLTCPRMCFFSDVCGVRPIVPSDKLLDGIGLHLCIGAYFQHGKDPIAGLQALEAWKSVLYKEYFEVNMNSDEINYDTRVDTVTNMYNAYIAELAPMDAPYEVIAVEQEFECPVIIPGMESVETSIKHTGTIDRVVSDRFGLWLGELKSASAFPNEASLELNMQVTLYMLAATEFYGKKPEGVLFDVVRKVKNPARARTEICKRFMVSRSARELQQAVTSLWYTVDSYMRAKDTDSMYQIYSPGMHCDWRCAYRPLCNAMNRGDDWESLMATGWMPKDKTSWEDKIAEVMKHGQSIGG